jgi:hypothetical protein
LVDSVTCPRLVEEHLKYLNFEDPACIAIEHSDPRDHGDEHVLFLVERSRIETPRTSQDPKLPGG